MAAHGSQATSSTNGAKGQIMKSTNEFIVELLSNAALTVPDIRTLFS
jgi:hypothetical protein